MQKKIRVYLHGARGKMGTEISSLLLQSKSFKLVNIDQAAHESLAGLGKVDLVIDFSSTDGNEALLKEVQDFKGLKILIGTTGLPEKVKRQWANVAQKQRHSVLIAPNTSIGIYVFSGLLKQISAGLVAKDFQVEIIETHHSAKKDAPSGTALYLARAIQSVCPKLKTETSYDGLRPKNALGIHAIRGGGVVGEHEVRFISANEEIKISHRAFSRKLFADGAISLATDLMDRKFTGLKYLEEF